MTQLPDVEKLCADTAKGFGLDVVFRQSNREGELVDETRSSPAFEHDRSQAPATSLGAILARLIG